MRYSIGQGYADSVPVSPLLSSATQRVFAATASSPAEFLCSWRKFLSLNDLPPLRFSLLSFSGSLPLFSSACSLFLRNTRGWGGYPDPVFGLSAGVEAPGAAQPQDADLAYASTFRMNTCKSVSKQKTLTPFRINTCEKPRGRGGIPSALSFIFAGPDLHRQISSSPCSLQPLAEVLLPTIRQRPHSQCAPQRLHVAIIIPFRNIQPSDFRHRHRIFVSRNHFDLVACPDFPLARDREIKPRPHARQESPDHVVGLKSHTQFVARQPRLRHHHFRGTDREPVAKMDGVFQQTIRSEVLPKHTHRQVPARQLFFPIPVMRNRVAVNRLEFSPMDAKVRLTVAVQIKLAQSNAALNRFLIDPSRHRPPAPNHLPRQPHVNRRHFHIGNNPFRLRFLCCAPDVGFAPGSSLKPTALKSRRRSRSVPKVKNFYHMPVFANLVIDQNRTVQQFPHTRPFSDRSSHAREITQKINVVEQRLTKTRGSLIIIFGNVPDDFS